jgi:hypothetical protein
MKKLLVTILLGLFFTGCAGYSERGAKGGPLVAPSPCRWTSNGIECDGNRDGTADLLINKSDGTVEINGVVYIPSDDQHFDLTADTVLTEAQIQANKYITNQGDDGEADITLPAVSYVISLTFIVSEAQIIEVNPPSGEAFDLNGTTLDADDCVDSPAVVGSKIVATRMQNAAGTWIWSLDTVRGSWVDTGASD